MEDEGSTEEGGASEEGLEVGGGPDVTDGEAAEFVLGEEVAVRTGAEAFTVWRSLLSRNGMGDEKGVAEEGVEGGGEDEALERGR